MPVFRQAQNIQSRQHFPDCGPALQVRTVYAPRGDNHLGLCCKLRECLVITRADRVGLGFHVRWQGRAVSEYIGHDQAAVAPVHCIADATAHGGIIFAFISRAGIESDEHGEAIIAIIPLSPQGIAILSAAAEAGASRRVITSTDDAQALFAH